MSIGRQVADTWPRKREKLREIKGPPFLSVFLSPHPLSFSRHRLSSGLLLLHRLADTTQTASAGSDWSIGRSKKHWQKKTFLTCERFVCLFVVFYCLSVLLRLAPAIPACIKLTTKNANTSTV